VLAQRQEPRYAPAMLARRLPTATLRPTAPGVVVRSWRRTASAPKTASGGLAPRTRHRAWATASQPTVAPGKIAPCYDFARRAAVLPRKAQPAPKSRLACLSNIDAGTWAGLGLDAVGVAASFTGLKAEWTIGSTITGVVAGESSMYLSAATGDSGGYGRAGFGAALAFAGSFEGASRLATNIPVVGAVVAVGVTGYDAYQALKKAGCF